MNIFIGRIQIRYDRRWKWIRKCIIMIDPRTHHHHHRHPHHCHHRHHYDKTLCFQVRQQEEKRIAPGKVKVPQFFGKPLTLIPSNSQSDQKYRFLCALPTEKIAFNRTTGRSVNLLYQCKCQCKCQSKCQYKCRWS